ncbi:HAMP domain-containing sensor histidine kinase [Lentibacillus amyloliquefaciens]|uniref:Signal transduction histidine-protein kinase ArlS n=1 Tax=Lentibacillus amyloliquefaciens TaxID=1472767 RepID=A0A0U4F6D5_9BACI|nr:HAMP domain-containing histidine kinase [Lentibacillus amyloliquefaciens]ALX49158.1 histidine kinase [Lentibacillus amyloliquefaciens]
MKLSVKIRLFSSLFMLVLILLVNTSIYYLFDSRSLEQELDDLNTQANEIISTLNENPSISQNEMLDAFLPTDGMIRVIDENDSHIVEVMKADYRELPGSYVSSESRSIISMDNQPDFATVAKPVIWENGDVVTLQIYKQLTGHTSTMETLFFVLVVASLIMLIPTIVAGVFLSRFITRPVQELTAAMKENTTYGSWKKISAEDQSKDELYEMKVTFNRMIDYLRENFEKQEMFVSDASHELKTPISIVKSYSQLMKRRGADNPELLEESTEAIESQADRMQKLVEQMLLLAKNKNQEVYEPFNLIELGRFTAETFSGAYAREIVFHASAEMIQINGSYDQLEQVLYILMDNAVKYSEEAVTLSIRKNGRYAEVAVKDNGPGISEADQEKIFDRFYRVDKSRSRETGGTGLGLSIAKVIAEAHGGTLSVSSTVGKGSVLTLILPLYLEN